MNVIRCQLKIMEKFGYQLSLSNCVHCGKEQGEDWFFSTQLGGVVCPDCVSEGVGLLKFPQKIREFLIELEQTDFDEVSRYDDLVNEKVCAVCFNLLKNYIQSHSEKEFKTTKMLEMV